MSDEELRLRRIWFTGFIFGAGWAFLLVLLMWLSATRG